MNRFDKITDSRAVRIAAITIFLLVAIIAAQAQTGYLVVVKDAFSVNVIKTTSIDTVQVIADTFEVNAKELLKKNNFFEVRTDWEHLYVERKRIVKGKYRRLKKEQR